MHRTDAPGNVGGMYDGGDPLIPREATVVTSDALNSFQEEIIAPISAAGIALVKGVNTQLRDALFALFGRLGSNNTWSGNQSFGGSVGVTGTTTHSGPTLLNGVTTANAHVTATAGATLTTATPNAPGIMSTGNGLGAGARLVGGNGGVGASCQGTNNHGGTFTGDGSGAGLVATGAAGQPGGYMRPGTAATATTPRYGLVLDQGYLSLDGSAAPNANVAIKNALTPRNISKVSASIATSGTGSVQIDDGFNAGGVTLSSGRVVLTFPQPFADGFYQVAIGAEDFPAPVQVKFRNKQPGSVEFTAYNGAGTLLNMSTQPVRFDVIITGRQ